MIVGGVEDLVQALMTVHYEKDEAKKVLKYINPIQTGLFFFASQDRGPYPCNSTTAYGMTPKFAQNDVQIISIIYV